MTLPKVLTYGYAPYGYGDYGVGPIIVPGSRPSPIVKASTSLLADDQPVIGETPVDLPDLIEIPPAPPTHSIYGRGLYGRGTYGII